MMTIITLIKPDRFNLRWLEAFKKVSQLILLCCYHETVAPSFLLLPSTIKNNFLMTSGQFEYLWIRSLLNGPLFSLVIRFFKCFSWTWLTFVIRLIRGTIINNLIRGEFICSKFAHSSFYCWYIFNFAIAACHWVHLYVLDLHTNVWKGLL